MNSALKIILKIYSALALIFCIYGIGAVFWGAAWKAKVTSWGEFSATAIFFILSLIILVSYLWQKIQIDRKIFLMAFIYLGVVVYLDATGNQFSNLWLYLSVVPLLWVAGVMASRRSCGTLRRDAACAPQLKR